jgi:hypothetical protein
MKPKFSDLITYINKALTGNDWNTNWQKIVNWLTLGTYDLKVNKIETNEIENSGTFTQNGNFIADNIQANTVTANSFVGDGSGLDNVRVTNTFPYTPFSINSAKSNFIVNDTTKLTFNVDDGTLHQPLIVTTANGKQITITSINDYDVSGLNGTYYIFVDEETNGGTVYLKTCEIFRQDTEPTGQNGDIWLDISNEPFVCREKVSNNWYSDIYNKVPIGKVVVSGGTITDLTILPFNVNGVTVVYNGEFSNDEQRPVVIVKTYRNGSDWYRVYSDGWCEQGGRTTISANTTKTVDLFVEYADTNYFSSANGGLHLSGNYGDWNWINGGNPYSTTQIKIQNFYDYSVDVQWEAKGYIK